MAQRSFEKDLERLEQIVKDLEEGDLALDDSLKRFEEGVRLARACEKALAQAEKRIEVLSKDSEGNLVSEPLDADSEDADEEACRLEHYVDDELAHRIELLADFAGSHSDALAEWRSFFLARLRTSSSQETGPEADRSDNQPDAD